MSASLANHLLASAEAVAKNILKQHHAMRIVFSFTADRLDAMEAAEHVASIRCGVDLVEGESGRVEG